MCNKCSIATQTAHQSLEQKHSYFFTYNQFQHPFAHIMDSKMSSIVHVINGV